ncbi:Retrotransposon-derived protein PEG10 AltName: Full=Embryonal carcinoma differentiation-regulated protein [Rhizoctonia solani AG-1 IB]|uniref:Rhizoctonia solani AG1-IB WGS project CAOJ00000000 data, isolate 7/3/14, contig 23237 n=1 Tax=Thanatephorus cucumeris (strain AG1-IB / isolate 7/3/14) TaxID=1108050 RepID=M5CAI2_THACB|nr:Retrotransposon-derived protein PEG10 AltName: Full=Embryonal carcinoma differentiation-regulated protein [Rhizoctonia solani AG-1 IB]
MATPSQPTVTSGQPQHQGFSAPFGEALTHPGSTTMDDLRDLLHRLISSVSELSTRVAETKEATKEVRATVENISQQVDIIAGKVDEPRTPEKGNTVTTVDQTPRPGPSGKQRVKLEPPANLEWHSIHSDDESEREDPAPATHPARAATILIGAASRSLSRTPGGTLKPIKVKAPEPFKGGTGTEAKQWSARMSGWLRLSATQFEREEDVITFLLVNMEGAASAWALPHLANIGTDKATIKTVDDFDHAFKWAFFDPDEQRAAERKITLLTQTTTTAAYATEFRTLLMSLDWNDAALRAQFYKGLHWHVKQQLAQKEDQPRDLEALIAAAIRIDNVRRELEISRPPRENRTKSTAPATTTRSANTGTPRIDSDRLKADPNYVSEAERQRRRDEKLCIKCGKAGHRFAECRTGWKGPEKGKETAKIANAEEQPEKE